MAEFDVLFVGGAPGSGKSTIGRAVASELGCGSLTGDDLATAARTVTSADKHPALHLMKGLHHAVYFTQGPPEKLIRDAKAQEDAMWPIIERVARSHLRTQSSVVIDWWLLAPERVVAMREDRIASIWLYIEPGVLWERERQNTDFLNGSDEPEKMLSNFMARSLWRNDLVLREARRHNLPVLVVSDQTVKELVAEALDLLD